VAQALINNVKYSVAELRNKTYTWYSGIWHGMFFIPNFIRSCIGDALYKANEYTTAYNVWWWITTVGAVGSTVFGYWGNRRSGY
uniref:hypothetical protein n=1 Tax=Segatella sp. TaxID=2974253 RepID=UPI003077603C